MHVAGRHVQVDLIFFTDRRHDQPSLFEVENGIPHDAHRQVQILSHRFGRYGSVAREKMRDNLVHHHEQRLLAVLVTHLLGDLFELELPDVLVGERQLGAEQHDLPTALQPNQEQRHGGKTAVYRIITGQSRLNENIGDLEQLKDRPGNHPGRNGAAQLHFRIRHHQIDECEHQPDHHQRSESEEYADHGRRSKVHQMFLYLQPDAAGDDPQDRRYDDHGRIIAEFACETARTAHFPNVVESAFDVPEYFQHGPEQHDQTHRSDQSALGTQQHRVGECDHLVDHDGILRELVVKILVQACFESEPLGDPEYERGDRNDRHQRIESQRGRAHQNPVLPEALRRKDEHFELAHRPTHFPGLVFVFFLYPDVVRDILNDFPNHIFASLAV